MMEQGHTRGHCRPLMFEARSEMWRKRTAETFNHRAAEVVKQTMTERNHHTCYFSFVPCLSPQHRNFDGQSIMHSKNRENLDHVEDRLSVSVFTFAIFFSPRTAISSERFVFVYSKLILLKLPDWRLLNSQQCSKHIKVPLSSLELTTWWLFVES